MRISYLLFPISLLPLSVNASAQAVPYPQASDTSIATVQVAAPQKAVLLLREEARQVAGAYEMTNGWNLRVHAGRREIEATIDNEKPMRLLAVSSSKFVSADGNVTMEFNLGPSGDDVRMSYMPGPNLAQIVVGSMPLAQR